MCANLRLDLIGEIWVVDQELARVLFTLAELVTFIGEPSTGFLYDAKVYTQVKEATFA